MARPRKNRLGDLAGRFGEELGRLLADTVAAAVAEREQVHLRELEALAAEVKRLSRKVELLSKKRTPKPRLGRWVPGGPGRPPKDARARIAAFNERSAPSRGKARKKRKG